MKKTKGFTLIELLIVIMLIGVLSGLILSVINVGGIRAKARDAQRVGDLKKIQTALELYFNDNRSYPTSSNAWVSISNNALNTALVSGGYINKMPSDPTPVNASSNPCTSEDDRDYWYRSESNTTTPGWYMLATHVEVVTSIVDGAHCNVTDLANWSCAAAATSNCYGVQNPF